MADLVVDPAAQEIKAQGSRVSNPSLFGEAVSPGEVVYLNSSDKKFYLADATTQQKSQAAGICLTNVTGDNDFGIVLLGGQIDVGATLTVGTLYVVSATGGAIAPQADLVSSDWFTIIGYATSTDTLILDINSTGTQIP